MRIVTVYDHTYTAYMKMVTYPMIKPDYTTMRNTSNDATLLESTNRVEVIHDRMETAYQSLCERDMVVLSVKGYRSIKAVCQVDECALGNNSLMEDRVMRIETIGHWLWLIIPTMALIAVWIGYSHVARALHDAVLAVM